MLDTSKLDEKIISIKLQHNIAWILPLNWDNWIDQVSIYIKMKDGVDVAAIVTMLAPGLLLI